MRLVTRLFATLCPCLEHLQRIIQSWATCYSSTSHRLLPVKVYLEILFGPSLQLLHLSQLWATRFSPHGPTIDLPLSLSLSLSLTLTLSLSLPQCVYPFEFAFLCSVEAREKKRKHTNPAERSTRSPIQVNLGSSPLPPRRSRTLLPLQLLLLMTY